MVSSAPNIPLNEGVSFAALIEALMNCQNPKTVTGGGRRQSVVHCSSVLLVIRIILLPTVLRRVHVLVLLGAADLEEREEETWGVPGRDHYGGVVLCAF
jgi:hypothetical protein